MTVLHRAHRILMGLHTDAPVEQSPRLWWGVHPCLLVLDISVLSRVRRRPIVRRTSRHRVILVPLHEPINIPPPWRTTHNGGG